VKSIVNYNDLHPNSILAGLLLTVPNLFFATHW